MADDQEKTEAHYYFLRHRKVLAMAALTLGSIQHRAQGTMCFVGSSKEF